MSAYHIVPFLRLASSEALKLGCFLSFCIDVKLMSEYFNELSEWDMRIQKVRVIVLLPRCSASALCNPVEFILKENGGTATNMYVLIIWNNISR